MSIPVSGQQSLGGHGNIYHVSTSDLNITGPRTVCNDWIPPPIFSPRWLFYLSLGVHSTAVSMTTDCVHSLTCSHVTCNRVTTTPHHQTLAMLPWSRSEFTATSAAPSIFPDPVFLSFTFVLFCQNATGTPALLESFIPFLIIGSLLLPIKAKHKRWKVMGFLCHLEVQQRWRKNPVTAK